MKKLIIMAVKALGSEDRVAIRAYGNTVRQLAAFSQAKEKRTLFSWI